MNYSLFLLFLGIAVCTFVACFCGEAAASSARHADPAAKQEHGMVLSDMKVQISSQGQTAIFQLYDTTAAKDLYDQLPLKLDLTNFRDAQWMFYPPKKLSVTPEEAYHDGKKGELSYYEPWGDAFMLYKDFYAGDEMHRLGICLHGSNDIAKMSGSAFIQKADQEKTGRKTAMKLTVNANGNEILFELNESTASRELYAQLPLSLAVENYSSNEKIFYPPKKLGTANTPLAKNVQPGTLAYYAPWGDVVMFYGSFGSAAGLYELGHAVRGAEHIKNASGTIRIEK